MSEDCLIIVSRKLTDDNLGEGGAAELFFGAEGDEVYLVDGHGFGLLRGKVDKLARQLELWKSFDIDVKKSADITHIVDFRAFVHKIGCRPTEEVVETINGPQEFIVEKNVVNSLELSSSDPQAEESLSLLLANGLTKFTTAVSFAESFTV